VKAEGKNSDFEKKITVGVGGGGLDSLQKIFEEGGS